MLNGASGQLVELTTDLDGAHMGFSTTYTNASAAADSVFSDALVTVDKNVVIKVYVKFPGGSWKSAGDERTLTASVPHYFYGSLGAQHRSLLKDAMGTNQYKVEVISVDGTTIGSLTSSQTIKFNLKDMVISGMLETSLSELNKTLVISAN